MTTLALPDSTHLNAGDTSAPAPARARIAVLGITLLGVALATIRLTGLPDLMDNEQQFQSAYVMDALQNGHWAMQLDETGAVASKPPLYTWLAAITALPFERINRFAITFPSMLATVAVGVILLEVGRRHFGLLAGWVAALVYLLSIPGMRQIGLARMDGLLPLMVTLGALAAWRAWNTGRGWEWFWVAASAITLTKGPPGILVAAAGLIARRWEPRPVEPRPTWPQHLTGIVLFITLAGGWFALACLVMGRPVYDKLIVQELFKHSVKGTAALFPGARFYVPPAQLFSRFLPWSLLTCFAVWRIWKRPDADPDRRRFERFVCWWLVGGLVPFCLAAHQRADLLLPLVVPAALLAGRQLTPWLERRSKALRLGLIYGGVAIGLTLAILRYHFEPALGSDLTTTKLARDIGRAPPSAVVMTLAVRDFARSIERDLGRDLPITHVDSPFALQFYLNTMRPVVSFHRAAELLGGEAAAIVAVCDMDSLNPHLAPGVRCYELVPPLMLVGHQLHLLSNRANPMVESNTALAVGPLTIETHGPHPRHAAARSFTFDGSGDVTLTNHNTRPETAILSRNNAPTTRVVLPAGEGRTVTLP